MAYVDGFVIPMAKKKLAAYRKMAKVGCKVWLEHGALEYRECIGEDLAVSYGLPFTKLTKAKKDETIAFSWILYKSRKHRDTVMAKVMKDKRLASMMDPKNMPFDMNRMSCGGFEVMVEGVRRR